MAEAFDELYYQGFETFSACSDEKAIYYQKFGEYIARFNVSSVLDIGAGNGDVAIPLSRQVDSYLAVEQNPEYADELEAAGLEVVSRDFPTNINSQFDLVIMSHVISHTAGNYRTLLPPAWELVKPDGHLLVVTHRTKNEEDNWSRLLDFVGLGYSEDFQRNIHALVMDVLARGTTEVETVGSTLHSPYVEPVLGAMAFLASNGEPDRHRRFMDKIGYVRQLLEDRYGEDGFTFPFAHLFLATHKPAA